jgi:hypothetical protein
MQPEMPEVFRLSRLIRSFLAVFLMPDFARRHPFSSKGSSPAFVIEHLSLPFSRSTFLTLTKGVWGVFRMLTSN